MGYKTDKKVLISVWRRQSENDEIVIPLDFNIKNVRIAYPTFDENSVKYENGKLTVCIGHIDSACIIEAEKE